VVSAKISEAISTAVQDEEQHLKNISTHAAHLHDLLQEVRHYQRGEKHDPMALFLKCIKLKRASHRVWFYSILKLNCCL
jgi:hypothetical protein